MNLQLDAMALNLPDVPAHPNRLPFRGVLTLVGVASQRSPSWRARTSRDARPAPPPKRPCHRSLGMALDYAPSLAGHDARRKIGIITEADIVPMSPGKSTNRNRSDCRQRLPVRS